jgi:hypothetical protein
VCIGQQIIDGIVSCGNMPQKKKKKQKKSAQQNIHPPTHYPPHHHAPLATNGLTRIMNVFSGSCGNRVRPQQNLKKFALCLASNECNTSQKIFSTEASNPAGQLVWVFNRSTFNSDTPQTSFSNWFHVYKLRTTDSGTTHANPRMMLAMALFDYSNLLFFANSK